MRVGPKYTGQFTVCNDKSKLVSKQCSVRKIPQFRLFLKIYYFRVWIPISEARKLNPRIPYLRALVRIAKSLYSGDISPVSGLAPVYARLGSTSYFVSGSESTILHIINLNKEFVSL
jgi:hypothetical protein